MYFPRGTRAIPYNGKAGPLVDGECGIEDRDGNHHGIDDRRRQRIQRAALADEPRNALPQALMRDPHVALEADAAGFDAVTPRVTGPIEFGFQFPLELRDVSKQIIDARRH